MKVKIVEDECTGCEECVEAVENIFEMSSDGETAIVKVETVPSELEDDVKEAADDCPAEAIVVE